MEIFKHTKTNIESPYDVHVRVSYTKILKVNTIHQSFEAEAIVESKWHAPEVIDLDYPISRLTWRPEMYIDNAVNEPREQTEYSIVQENEKFMVYEIKKIKGLFSESLELQNFPLDIQNLTLHVTSRNSTEQMNIVLAQPEFSMHKIAHTLDQSLWHMHNVVKVRENDILREYSFGKREYPCVQISCQVFRNCGYYHWNALLPIMLITLCSMTPFLLDYTATASRLGTTASMLLSAVSYKIAVSRLLPTVSYLTSMDKYCIASLVIIACMLGYHGVFGLFIGTLDAYDLKYYDRMFFMIFISVLLLKQFVYVRWLLGIHEVREELVTRSAFWDQQKKYN